MGSDCIHWDLAGDFSMLAEKGAPLGLLLVVILVGVLYDRQAYQKYRFYATQKPTTLTCIEDMCNPFSTEWKLGVNVVTCRVLRTP